MTSPDAVDTGVRLGLKENLAQLSLLVGVNALVGGVIGQERTVLPLFADQAFGLTAFTGALTFIAAFGAVKAATKPPFTFRSGKTSTMGSATAGYSR